VAFLTEFYLRNLEADRELKELREQSQAQEAKIRELQRMLANDAAGVNPAK
jgi:hypothetical protein